MASFERDLIEECFHLFKMIKESYVCDSCQVAISGQYLLSLSQSGLITEGSLSFGSTAQFPLRLMEAYDHPGHESWVERSLAGPHQLLKRLEQPEKFDALVDEWEQYVKTATKLYSARQAMELAVKMRFACQGQYTLEDLYANRRIRGFISMTADRLIQSAEPFLGDECLCLDRDWFNSIDLTRFSDHDFANLVIKVAKSQMDEKIAETLGDIPLPNVFTRLSIPQLRVGSGFSSASTQTNHQLLIKLYEVVPAVSQAVGDHWLSSEVQARLYPLEPLAYAKIQERWKESLRDADIITPSYSEATGDGTSSDHATGCIPSWPVNEPKKPSQDEPEEDAQS